ncbi:MAG: hypothetical protein JXR37_38005 [Kiritimatiellae bacterium]|nr:hypothetical protein [Kiritimatiellia bacterium]
MASAGSGRNVVSFRSLLTGYSVIWVLMLLFLQVAVCPETAHTYGNKIQDLGMALPNLTRSVGLPVIGYTGPGLSEGPPPAFYFAAWLALYLTAAVPIVLVWAAREESRARWLWVYAAAGHGLLFVVLLVLTGFSLYLPFMSA